MNNNRDNSGIWCIVAFIALIGLFIASYYYNVHLISDCNVDTLC